MNSFIQWNFSFYFIYFFVGKQNQTLKPETVSSKSNKNNSILDRICTYHYENIMLITAVVFSFTGIYTVQLT